MAEVRTRRIVQHLLVIAIATWTAGSGCDGKPKAPSIKVEYPAVRLIDYETLPPVMDDILHDVFSGEIVGKPMSDYPAWKDSLNEVQSDAQLLNFHLPLDAENGAIAGKDGLAHSAWLWIRLDADGRVKSAELRELVF